jgi:prophage maintenance system killer protein
VLAHGIAETQPFVDGNKREALVATLTFLELKRLRRLRDRRELADWIMTVSAGATPQVPTVKALQCAARTEGSLFDSGRRL